MKITVKDEESARAGTRRRAPAIKSGEGIRFQKTITINRPVSEVYSFWRDFNNLPRFMKHLDSVTVEDNRISRWRIAQTEKNLLEWSSELIEDRANEIISWQSLPGADVDNAGSVWFRPATGNRGTFLKLALKYAPPGGKTAAKIDRLKQTIKT
ncbi:MAG TPA: SRPBCC family protein [Verrucomicrobiae bacterium]|nr:SRPBCC family protein [Verrucomicrobiae bacterium]